MSQSFKRWVKGLIFRDNDTTGIGDLSGTLTSADNGAVYIYQQRMKAFLNGSETEIATVDQSQTFSNKTISSVNNTLTINADEATVSNLEVDNLKAGVLDSDLSTVSASHDTIPSAKATKDYVDAQVAGKDEASEISFDDTNPNVTGTNVQDAVDDVADSAAAAATAASTAQSTADNHIADAVDAHDASAISYNPAGSSLTSTEMQATADEIAGRLDTTETNTGTNTTNLSNHIADTTAHGTTGNVVGTSDTQDLSNKTFTDAITLEEQASKPSTPASGDKKLYAKTDGKIYTLDDADNEIEVGSGTGSDINYIDQNDAEDGISDWVTYADAADVKPGNMNGGSPVSTFNDNGTNPLRGTKDFKFLVASGATRQGEGVRNFITIDNADLASILEISFDYDASDVNYNDGNIRVYVYDITNGQLIEPVKTEVPGGKGKFTTCFQTAPDSTDYRVGFHVARSSGTNQIEFFFDNFRVGPARSCSSSSSNTIGSFYLVSNQAVASTATTKVLLDGVLGDTEGSWDSGNNRYVFSESGWYEVDGQVYYGATSGSPYRIQCDIRVNGTTKIFNQIASETLGNGSGVSSSKSYYFEKGDYIELHGRSPDDSNYNFLGGEQYTFLSIAKSSSGSCGGSEAAISSSITKSSAQSIGDSSYTKVTFDGTDHDTSANFDDANDRFIAPQSGKYNFTASVGFASNATGTRGVWVYVNGSSTKYIYQTGAGATLNNNVSVSGTLDLNKDDYVEVQAYQNSGGNLNVLQSSSAGGTYLDITLASSGGSCSKSNTVAMKASTDSSQVIATSLDDVIFEDLAYNKGAGSYNVSTGEYTVGESGLYIVKSLIQFSANGTGVRWQAVHVNGVLIDYSPQVIGSATGAVGVPFSTELELVKGDVVKMRARQTSGAGLALNPGGSENYFIIRKVGD